MEKPPSWSPKQGPAHCPVENFPGVIEAHSYGGVSLFLIKKTLLLPKGTHAHADYEFLLPLSPMPPAQVEKRKLAAEPQKLLPINPEQVHENSGQPGRYRFLSIEIGEDFLREIGRSRGGKGEIFFLNEYLQLKNDLQDLIRLFIEEAQNKPAGYDFVLESLAAQLTVNLLRQAKTNLPMLPPRRNYTEKENINRAIDFLREQYNEDHSLEEVARLVHLSLYHFIRVFKVHIGKTPHEYLVDVKVEKARELLKFSNFCIAEICSLCGFKSPSHFATVFKRKMGISPSEYRNLLEKGLDSVWRRLAKSQDRKIRKGNSNIVLRLGGIRISLES